MACGLLEGVIETFLVHVYTIDIQNHFGQTVLKARDIPLLEIRPLLDFVKVHHSVRSAISFERVTPVSIDCAFRVPFKELAHIRFQLALHGVDYQTAYYGQELVAYQSQH